MPLTAIAEVAPPATENVPATLDFPAPTITLASPAFEVVEGSPDVFLRIFPTTSDAIAA